MACEYRKYIVAFTGALQTILNKFKANCHVAILILSYNLRQGFSEVILPVDLPIKTSKALVHSHILDKCSEHQNLINVFTRNILNEWDKL